MESCVSENTILYFCEIETHFFIMIIFLYGKDSFRSREQLAKMKQKFTEERDPERLNVVQLDCLRASEETIMNVLWAPPFLAEKRMVILESLIESPHEELRAMIKEKIEAQTLPNFLILVCLEVTDTFKKKEQKELFARLQKEKYAQAFDVLTDARLSGWIAATVSERKGKIHKSAVLSLMNTLEGDMWQLHHGIDQLLAYANGREITAQDVALFVEQPVGDNIFTLIDAIVAKKPADVFAMIEAQYSGGKDPLYIFAMLVRQFRIFLEIKDMEERTTGAIQPSVVATELKLHPFVVKKSLAVLRHYSLPQLRTIYAELLAIDEKIKTGLGDASVLIDAFVAELCVSGIRK